MDQPEPVHSPVDCSRTQFLEALLDDEERGRLGAVGHYLERFPEIAEFVQAEYAALCAQGAADGEAGESLPARLGRYEVRRALAEGGMGRVYEAYDPQLRRRVVVKSLRCDLGEPVQARERLRREARVLGQLAHPQLTRVLDLIEVEGQAHLVMAFHEGRTLGDHIAAARVASEGGGREGRQWLAIGPQPAANAEALRRLVAFFVQVAGALHSAHRVGIVHRDLKPHNLMVSPDGAPVVLDFGLALPGSDDRLTVAGELLGTPLYMAPEQIEGGVADARTDVYALGVTMYEALTLVSPFAGSGGRAAVFHRILRGDPVSLRRHQPLVARDLEAVVLRAMERVPVNRYPDMQALAQDLQRVVDREPTEARPVSGAGMVWRRVRRRPWAAGMATLTAVSLLLAVWFGCRFYGLFREVEARAKGGPVSEREYFTDLTKRYRDSDRLVEQLQAVHPVGTVLSATCLTWIGLPVQGEPGTDDADFRYSYEYHVEFFDGATVVSGDVRSGETQRCSWPLPEHVHLVVGRTYQWNVTLTKSYEVTMADGVAPTGDQLARIEALNRLSVSTEDWRREEPPLEATFEIRAPLANIQSADPRQRARLLEQNGLWADLLLQLEDDWDRDSNTNMEYLGLLAKALEGVDDRVRLAHVQEILKRKPIGGQ